MKTFHHKNKLKEFSTTKPVLWRTVEGIRQTEKQKQNKTQDTVKKIINTRKSNQNMSKKTLHNNHIPYSDNTG